jgi:hypothetical protein
MSSLLDHAEIAATGIPPEQRLFLGVILNAVEEARGAERAGERGAKAAQTRAYAAAWFKEAGEDFQAVCSLAGLEPEKVRAGVLNYLDRVSSDPSLIIKQRRGPSVRKPKTAVSIADVAGYAGVSSTSVGRFLNGSPKVGQTTRNKIQEAIVALGYVTADGGNSVH